MSTPAPNLLIPWRVFGDIVTLNGLGRRAIVELIQLWRNHLPPRARIGRNLAQQLADWCREHGGPTTPPIEHPQNQATSKAFLKRVRSGEVDHTVLDLDNSPKPQQPATAPKAQPPAQPDRDNCPDVDTEQLLTDLGLSWVEMPRLEDEQGNPLADAGDLEERGYTFDERTATYHTWMEHRGRFVVTSHLQHEHVHDLYTRLQGNQSRLTVCRRMGWSWLDVLTYLKAHQIQKSSLPISREEIEAAESEADLERLAESVNSRKFRALELKIIEKRDARDKRDAERWRSMWVTSGRVVARILPQHAVTEHIPRAPVAPSRRPWVAVAGYTDVHWGCRSWEGESGHRYSCEIAAERIDHVTTRLIERLNCYHGRPERIIVPCGSDWFHVDGIGKTAQTTAGTPQHVDGTPAELYETGRDAFWRVLERLAEVAQVLVVPMRGNHDSFSAFALLQYVQGRAQHLPWLDCVGSFEQRVALDVLGSCVGFTHGNTGQGGTAKTEKRKSDYADWLAAEAAKLGLPTGAPRIVYTGHLHHHYQEDHRGVEIVIWRALCDPDAWHAAQGYTGSRTGLDVRIIEQGHGETDRIFLPTPKGPAATLHTEELRHVRAARA